MDLVIADGNDQLPSTSGRPSIGSDTAPVAGEATPASPAGGGAQLSCVDADTTPPTVAISSDAGAAVTFSEPVTGFELENLVVGNGSASELRGNNASYMATITPAASGTVTVGHRGREPRGTRAATRARRRCSSRSSQT